MKALTLFFATSLLFASCAETSTIVTGYKGNKPIGSVVQRHFLYGQENYSNTLFGIIDSSNLDIGFQQFANMFATLTAAYIAGDVAKAKEVTTQLANAGATKTQIAQIKTAAQQAAHTEDAANVAKGLDAGVFTPGGTVFKQ